MKDDQPALCRLVAIFQRRGSNRYIWPSIAISVLLAGGAIRYWHAGIERRAILQADPDQILSKPDLAPLVLDAGRKAFLEHCAACHGRDAKGSREGVPDLTDADFLYGTGLPSEIEAIVLHGIRSGDKRGFNLASMPAFGREKPYVAEPIPPLQPGEIADVVQFLLARQHSVRDLSPAAVRGEVIFRGKGGCFDCHGPSGTGDPSIGAPNLTDSVTLYGNGSAQDLFLSIAIGRAGRCPAFSRVMSPLEAREVAVYVASLHPNYRPNP